MNRRIFITAAVLTLSFGATSAGAEALHDPTRPATLKASASTTPAAATVRLEAILRAEGRHVAIVNGKVVRVGDRVGDAIIIEINDHAVAYIRAGARHVSSLVRHELNVRRSPNSTDPS